MIIPIYPITDPLGLFFTQPQPAPNGRYTASKEEMTGFLDHDASVVASCGKVPNDPRSHMYLYRIARNIHQYRLPPTYVLHGDVNTAVGVEQSDEVVGTMLGCSVPIEYKRPHGKDYFLDNSSDYQSKAIYTFMMRYL
ncbi:hypothetical protein EDD36DRAFT_285166 [Exophiala viscosa]|uniref:Uncharacterized protein n=1 Tax=Exophiala viscosa TaxID=2486360 RepID=A0AAN6DTF6_9EURO|nr:hypothetical protein EDD36DRAFT_285166 [Exophiala viscosa]